MSEETKTVFDDGAALVVRSNEELPEKLALMREAQKVFATLDRKSTRLNSSHRHTSRMPSSA